MKVRCIKEACTGELIVGQCYRVLKDHGNGYYRLEGWTFDWNARFFMVIPSESKAQIVSIQTGWGRLDANTWKTIHAIIARGDAVGLWNGRFRDMPGWRMGKCSLRVKVGKKRKLVKGRLEQTYEGFDEGGETYGIEFIPNRPRVLGKGISNANGPATEKFGNNSTIRGSIT